MSIRRRLITLILAPFAVAFHLAGAEAAVKPAIDKHVTLLPGDLIFTGISGQTSALHAGDVVEVELEGVGPLRNRVRGER